MIPGREAAPEQQHSGECASRWSRARENYGQRRRRELWRPDGRGYVHRRRRLRLLVGARHRTLPAHLSRAHCGSLSAEPDLGCLQSPEAMARLTRPTRCSECLTSSSGSRRWWAVAVDDVWAAARIRCPNPAESRPIPLHPRHGPSTGILDEHWQSAHFRRKRRVACEASALPLSYVPGEARFYWACMLPVASTNARLVVLVPIGVAYSTG